MPAAKVKLSCGVCNMKCKIDPDYDGEFYCAKRGMEIKPARHHCYDRRSR